MYPWTIQTKLSKTICDEIVKQIEEDELYGPLRNGRLVGNKHDTNVRKSGTILFPATSWVAGMMAHYVNVANKTFFNYELNDLWSHDKIQYALYDKNAHYTWHFDDLRPALEPIGNDRDKLPKVRDQVRKLSFSLQLSDPDDYEGGDMQLVNFLDSKVPEEEPRYKINPVPRDQGTIIVFPSTMLHRVSPITKGIRRSVVGWAMGPPLR